MGLRSTCSRYSAGRMTLCVLLQTCVFDMAMKGIPNIAASMVTPASSHIVEGIPRCNLHDIIAAAPYTLFASGITIA